MKTDRIALIVATEFECLEIVSSLVGRQSFQKGHFIIHRGRLSGRKTVVVIGGPGKTNAGAATVIAILQFGAEKIINLGIGGAFVSSGLNVGGLAICTEDIYVEEGTLTRKGHRDLRKIGLELIPKRDIYNRIPFSDALAQRAEAVLSKGSWRYKKGRFITVSTVTGTSSMARELESRYRAICESMEGAAVGQIALSFGIPALQIRGISNLIEDRDRRKWRIKEAALACQRAVLQIIKEL